MRDNNLAYEDGARPYAAGRPSRFGHLIDSEERLEMD